MSLKKLYDEAVAASAAYAAAAVIETATDCGDDPTTYALDNADLVKGYLNGMPEDIAACLPAAVEAALKRTPSTSDIVISLLSAVEAECRGKSKSEILGIFEDLYDDVKWRTDMLYHKLTALKSSSPKAK